MKPCLRAVVVGVGGTVVLDVWAAAMGRITGKPVTNWPMFGRWLGHMTQGQFVQPDMRKACPVRAEAAIGWSAHYAIGIGYGLGVLAWRGPTWFSRPTLGTPLKLVWMLLVAPYFIMMPGMGLGVAGSKTPHPTTTRIKSVIGHSVFGLGMYATALILRRK